MTFYLDNGNIAETIRLYIMGRIVDAKTFFIKYCCDPTEEDACFSFKIEDNFLDWNNKSFTVFFHHSRTTITDREPTHIMGMTIGILTGFC